MIPPAPSARRRRLWPIIASAACALVLVGYWIQRRARATGALASAAGFNVLVITLDTTRADHLGVYGRAEAVTPAIDALAASGIRFDDAVTCVPITLPAHASLFTGLYPPRHGVRNNGDSVLGAEHETLAEVLRAAGYATAAFPSAIVLDSRYALNQGFEVYDDGYAMDTDSDAFGGKLERSAREVTDAAMAWLATRDERPFLLWVHYYDPHYPYSPPPEFAPTFRHRPYDGEIAYTDTQVARLLADLDRSGLRERTIIVLVGDHGQGRGDHGENRHGCLIYDSVMRVPLILSCPGLFEPGVVAGRVVSIVDVFPTLLETLGIGWARDIDGRSLLDERHDPDRAVYMESLLPLRNHGWAPLFGLRRHDEKFILAPTPEFYDLRTDPAERVNLHATASERASELERRLRDVLGGRPTIESLLGTPDGIDPTLEAQLSALGYGGDVDPSDRNLGVLDPKDVIQVSQLVEESRMLQSRSRGPDRRRMLDEALAKVQGALRTSPQDREALQQLARVQIARQDYGAAERALHTFLDIKPSADVYVILAQVLIATKRLDQADTVLLAAERLEPNHGGVATVRGDGLLARGRFDEAIAAYRQALEVDPHRSSRSASLKLQRAQAAKAAAERR